jgi:hypothetical protein
MSNSAHHGAWGSQKKLRSAEIPAMTMPATRAQVWPRSTKMPITANPGPIRRCIQPHAVRSKA